MKKNDFILPAVFLLIVIFLFVIPISAFLTSEVIGWQTTKSLSDWVYQLLKDQGSLIAGILGVLGVIILVIFQKISNREIIENSRELIILERREAEKNKFYLDLRDMERLLYMILYKINESPQNEIRSKVYDDFEDKLHGIMIFLKKYTKHYSFFELLREIAAYHRWVAIEKDDSDAVKYFWPDLTHILRCSKLFDQVIDDYLNINQKEDDHKRGWDDSCETIKKMREDFFDRTKKEFTDIELSVFLHYFYSEYKSFIDKSVRL